MAGKERAYETEKAVSYAHEDVMKPASAEALPEGDAMETVEAAGSSSIRRAATQRLGRFCSGETTGSKS
jgi:hypothetical protein